MTDEPDNPALIALATAMSEGATIDWDEAERTAASEPDRQRVQELRELATLVAAHHALGDETAAPAAATHRRWRHLVIFESIGDGAFGTVYRAWDPRLERQVAVKLLRSRRRTRALPSPKRGTSPGCGTRTSSPCTAPTRSPIRSASGWSTSKARRLPR